MNVMGDKTAGPVSADLKNHARIFLHQSPKEMRETANAKYLE